MNIVVGVSAGYGVPCVWNFVRSFRRHSRAELVLFLQATEDATREWLHAQGAATIDLESNIHPKFGRYFAMHELLESYPEYTRLYHSDVRDAVAQHDIFERIPEEGLHVFLEDSGTTIGSCSFNGRWILDIYDSDTLARYGDRAISCSGSTLGDRESILVYARSMMDEYERLRDALPVERRLLLLHDQALHNHLIHSGILEERLHAAGRKLIVHANGDGVLTMGYARNFGMAKPGGLITTPEGGIPAVLHQYDRVEFLREYFDARYAR